MLTPAYALTATERVLPRMALDFTTGVLDPRVTVTRALNTATRVNSSGFVEVVNADLPRFDYDPITLAPKGLLIEESRVNELLYSSTFDDAVWGLTASGTGVVPTVTPNAGISPDGTNNAYRLEADRGASNTLSDASVLRQQPAVTYANPHNMAVSIWAKSNTGLNQNVYFRNATATGGTVIIVTPTWQRFSFAGSVVANFDVLQIGCRGGVNLDQSIDILIWNGQLEIAAFPTSDIITGATRLTRNADVVSMTGTNFSDWYNASEGTFVADVNQSPASGLVVALDAAANASNRISLIKAATSGFANFFVFTAAFPEANITNSNVIGTGKIVGAYKANNCGLSSNGVAAITDTSVVLPTPTFLRIGARQDGGNAWNAPIKRVLYYPQRLTNAEVQAFSK